VFPFIREPESKDPVKIAKHAIDEAKLKEFRPRYYRYCRPSRHVDEQMMNEISKP
jgi:signal recognition particle GTPase